MAKILFISNIAKRVGSFSIASIAASKECGLEYYYAANWDAATKEQRIEDEERYGIKLVHIDLVRFPGSFKNIKAYKQLVEFIKREQIDYIHCNTPVGGMLGRLAGEKCDVKKIIYQAHGFHFYDGAPKKNWLIYYPIEKWLAKKTDAIITINKEDYERAKSFKLRNGGLVYYVPGVGMDLKQYEMPESLRDSKRKELGLKETDIAVISMGDIIARKNYQIAIEAVERVKNSRIHYFICGEGPDEAKLKEMVKTLNIEKQIHFLGYRSDIKELLKASDVFLFTSKQEGLARSLMEAMASGIPCIVSDIRGNSDLITDNVNGFLCGSLDEYVDSLKKLVQSPDVGACFVQKSSEIIKNFSVEKVKSCIYDIYSKEFE